MSMKRSLSSPPTPGQTTTTQIDVGLLSRDERPWKNLLNSDSCSSSMLNVTTDDISVPSIAFLYDYYGITEETQHGPPSPGTRYASCLC